MPASGYYLDPCTFSLVKLKDRLKSIRLIPSQRILLENIDERFAILERNGIENLEQLQKALKTKNSVLSLSKATGLPADYLTILRREVNGFHPKPIDLEDFPGVDSDIVRKLGQAGIKNTEQLFPHVLTRKDRIEFAKRYQIEDDDLLDLARLTDLARLRWVGPKFARLLIESGYDTVEKVANSDYEKLYLALIRANETSGVYKGKFGADDMRVWVSTAVQDVPRVIEY